ncbi:MAG TPA: hypothetical protein VFT22_23140, partial [Kofleriaceae bacterium]|nr:hypothetical protein [Kofleriaceae bacterium]
MRRGIEPGLHSSTCCARRSAAKAARDPACAPLWAPCPNGPGARSAAQHHLEAGLAACSRWPLTGLTTHDMLRPPSLTILLPSSRARRALEPRRGTTATLELASMMKISIALLAGISLATPGCHKDHDKDRDRDSLARLIALKAKMCACPDKTCSDKVSAELAEWGQQQETAAGEKAGSPEERDREKLEAIKEQIASCLLKLEVPTGGSATGATGAADSAGGAGSAGTAGAAGAAGPSGAAGAAAAGAGGAPSPARSPAAGA